MFTEVYKKTEILLLAVQNIILCLISMALLT
jgi:hypothetical protein